MSYSEFDYRTLNADGTRKCGTLPCPICRGDGTGRLIPVTVRPAPKEEKSAVEVENQETKKEKKKTNKKKEKKKKTHAPAAHRYTAHGRRQHEGLQLVVPSRSKPVQHR